MDKYPGHFFDIMLTNLGFTNCAGGQVSSPELNILLIPKKPEMKLQSCLWSASNKLTDI